MSMADLVSSQMERSEVDPNDAFDLLHRVHLECRRRWAVDHRSGGDLKPGAVALAHDRRATEQTAGEWTCLTGAGAEVIERKEAVVDTRDRDPSLVIVQVIGNYEPVGDCVTRPERADGISSELSHRLLLSSPLSSPF